MKFDTALLHGAFEGDKTTGATLTPIYQSSAFGQESAEHIEKIFHNEAPGFAYSRISNPTIASFENRITYLEGGIGSVATSSGMAAITSALLNILQSGDEIISTESVFGGTLDLFRDLQKFGITTRFIDSITEENLAANVNKNTKAVFAETIGNPKLDVTDIKKSAELIHKHNLPFILDNTIATACLVKGIELGADIIINSSSKYINGSSNSISGVITDSGNFKWTAERYPAMAEYIKFGKLAFIARLRNDIFRNIGCCTSPQNAFYNMLGLETLSLRMERHCRNALQLAQYLENQDGVKEVNYPLLKSSPYYDTAIKQFSGRGGGIITVRLHTKERAFAFINRLKYAVNLTNVGDVRTLVIHPESTIYAHASEKGRKNAGVYDDLVRISVGIEDIEDLLEDFDSALKYINENHGNSGNDSTAKKNYADDIIGFFNNRDEGLYDYIDETVEEICSAAQDKAEIEPLLQRIYKDVSVKLFEDNEWLDLYISNQSSYEAGSYDKLFLVRIKELFKEYCKLFPNVSNEKIQEVILYILNNPESDLKQKTIAAELYINSSYLSTVFAAQTQQRFVDYLTTIKLKRAEWLLKNTDIKVTEIATRLDYKDIGYFSRLFKRQYGVTPTELRIPDDYTYQI
ncbi:MAG: PLP-dependent transferase [Oscillospiraceae bacterium]|nr:PLP-dependent transferase [Oscillospiraceae bacterium]